MLRLIVDSGSSIKQEERKKYNIDIIPLKILFDDIEYEDGVDLSMEKFYDYLLDKKIFPKTSLPNLAKLEEMVASYTYSGDTVIILTLSSKISGTFNAFKQLFEDNKNVYVIDSKLAVGGIRILVEEINKYRDQSITTIIEKINALIPKIRVLAIPETLLYLTKGGRLSKVGLVVGSLLKIIPIITFNDGRVDVMDKKRGFKNAMRDIVNYLNEHANPLYSIVPSFTHLKDNLINMIDLVNDELKKLFTPYDELTPAISAHWGPNAAGFIFVEK